MKSTLSAYNPKPKPGLTLFNLKRMNNEIHIKDYRLTIPISKKLLRHVGLPNLDTLRKMKVKCRRASYKGIGRPRREDVVYVPFKDYPDFMAAEFLNNGASTSYTNINRKKKSK